MATSAVGEKTIRTGEVRVDAQNGPSLALDLAKEAAGERKQYYCVVDRLAYCSLDMALVHVRMQHGTAARASLLLRTGIIGRGR